MRKNEDTERERDAERAKERRDRQTDRPTETLDWPAFQNFSRCFFVLAKQVFFECGELFKGTEFVMAKVERIKSLWRSFFWKASQVGRQVSAE